MGALPLPLPAPGCPLPALGCPAGARGCRAGAWGVDSVLCHGRLDEDIPRGSQGDDTVHRDFDDAALRGEGGNDRPDGGGRDAGG